MDVDFVQDDGSVSGKNHGALPYVDKCFTEKETEKNGGRNFSENNQMSRFSMVDFKSNS